MARLFNSRLGNIDPEQHEGTQPSVENDDAFLTFPEFRDLVGKLLDKLDQSRTVEDYIQSLHKEMDSNPKKFPISVKNENSNKRIGSFNSSISIKKLSAIAEEEIVCPECDGESALNNNDNKKFIGHCDGCTNREVCEASGNKQNNQHCNACFDNHHCDGRERVFYNNDENAICSTCDNKGNVCPTCENRLLKGAVCQTCNKVGQTSANDPRVVYPKTSTDTITDFNDIKLSDEASEEELNNYFDKLESKEEPKKLELESNFEEKIEDNKEPEAEHIKTEKLPFSSIEFDKPNVEDEEDEEDEENLEDEEDEKDEEEHIEDTTPEKQIVEPLQHHGPWCKCKGTGIIQDPIEIGKINTSSEFKKGITEINNLPISDDEKNKRQNQFVFDQYRCKGI
jgi:predicted RNA-binding protein Jag